MHKYAEVDATRKRAEAGPPRATPAPDRPTLRYFTITSRVVSVASPFGPFTVTRSR